MNELIDRFFLEAGNLELSIISGIRINEMKKEGEG